MANFRDSGSRRTRKAEGADGKAVRAAAQKALAGEFDKRAERFANAPNGDLALASDGLMRWLGAPVASLSAGEDALKPKVVILADEQLTGPSRDKVAARAERFFDLSGLDDPEAAARPEDGRGAGGHRARPRLPADREFRPPAAPRRLRGGARARSGLARRAPALRRALRRLPHLRPDADQAGPGQPSDASVGASRTTAATGRASAR